MLSSSMDIHGRNQNYMAEYEVIIGIDPGEDKRNGFAAYSLVTQSWTEDLGQYRFFDMLDVLQKYKQEYGDCVLVCLEDTAKMSQLYERNMKSFYKALDALVGIVLQILAGNLKLKLAFMDLKAKLVGEVKICIRKSNNVGHNAGISRKVKEYCKRIGLPLDLIQPSASSYSKLTSEEMYALTGIETLKTYEHQRDAMGLVLSNGVPIKNPIAAALTDSRQLSPYQQRVKKAYDKSLLNLQLKKNKQKRYQCR